MADLTLKLIWYKLGETYSKMAEAGASMQSWFSWEDHFLDVLLIFWISFGLLIVGVINSLTTFFGPLQPRISWEKPKDGGTATVAVSQGPHQPESTVWLNSALNWFYLHYNQFPQFVDAWVQALNEQANKLGGPVQLRFEKVQSGSLPPKFGEVTYDAGPEDKFILTARVDSRDLSFALFASQQTHEGVKLTNLVITVLRLRGQLRIRCYRQGNDMMAEISFLGRPDIKVQGKPVNPYMDPSDMVDVGVVQEVVRNTICLTSTTLNLSEWISQPAERDTIPVQRQRSTEMGRSSENLQHPGSAPQSPRHVAQVAPEVFEPKEVPQTQTSAFHVPTLQTPTKIPQQRPTQAKGPGDKRVLVKVIKASGLKQNAGAVDPYCVMHVDTPPQTEVTNTVRSTYNPFWDEQFYFDLNKDSQEIRFEVLDKSRPQNDNFLGEAVVYCEDLARNPSSRQIIPLQGRLGVGEFVSGSVTVEFLYMSASDVTNTPRRTIETSKSMTPGGTLVTTTTTTTQRPQNSRYDTATDGSPSYIEKRTFDYNSSNPEMGTSEVVHINGVESVAETAIRALSERSKTGKKTPAKTSTLIITGVKREVVVPKIKTIESSPTDEESSRLSAPNIITSPESPEISYPPQTKDDIDLHRVKQNEENAPTLKKSRSLGGSLKKLFRRSRKRSRSQGRGEQSRESSVSRQSRHTSQGPSREGSLTRSSQHTSHQDTVIL
ncbi:phospholipid transfer protein C2CD2L-like isoform X4 [Mercenaria mercenaria]|uniref:phospholipid transfer protein C2CD2L-like isoform X4 n=1 Tax=Mercenaria mercenaria TaxID=6596 RepID=UPI001E1E05D5|nr:phospholipid transfer protein C2CD2L-like isoform X4 [Mercenaria mercenaria]